MSDEWFGRFFKREKQKISIVLTNVTRSCLNHVDVDDGPKDSVALMTRTI